MVAKLLSILCIVLVCIGIPFFIDTYYMHICILIFYYAYLSSAWNIIGGFGGQLSLGHALFFGVGAYTSTILFVIVGLSPWVGMFAGGIAASTIAYLVGRLIFRYKIRGVFFAITTLAFAEIARILCSEFRFTGGSEGLLIPLRTGSIWDFQYESKIVYYYIIFAMMLVMLLVSWMIKKSKYYYYLAALRADEEAASALGVNSMKQKTTALVISAFFTAIGGTFFAQYYMFIEPHITFDVMTSVDMIIRPIIGGVGTVFGPVLGSIFITPLGEMIRAVAGGGKSGIQLLIYGAVLIAICIWMPKGILPYIMDRFKKNDSGAQK
jgi:branched-chain amino acid transport system permease protein